MGAPGQVDLRGRVVECESEHSFDNIETDVRNAPVPQPPNNQTTLKRCRNRAQHCHV